MADTGPKFGSQFFITVSNASHYNGRNLVFGRVIKGIGIVKEVRDAKTTDTYKPIKAVVIGDCGEFPKGTQDYGIGFADGTEDIYPNYPEDFDPDLRLEKNSEKVLEICGKIKSSGNGFYKSKDFRNGMLKLVM